MCTVTFIPTKKGGIISSNRDEIISRAVAEYPGLAQHGQHALIYPKDPLGGGTWICGGRSAIVCLFNGAFEKHKHQPPYRHSRGLVPLAVFEFKDAHAFCAGYDFEGIEPFSIVIFDGSTLTEVKWDGVKPHEIKHDASQHHIWASATLYDESVRNQRKRWFDAWSQGRSKFDQTSIMQFHTAEKYDDVNGLLINRTNGLKTVSVCSLDWDLDLQKIDTLYIDRINNKTQEKSWIF